MTDHEREVTRLLAERVMGHTPETVEEIMRHPEMFNPYTWAGAGEVLEALQKRAVGVDCPPIWWRFIIRLRVHVSAALYGTPSTPVGVPGTLSVLSPRLIAEAAAEAVLEEEKP